MRSRMQQLLHDWGEHIVRHGWADPVGLVTVDPRLTSKADGPTEVAEIDLECLDALDAVARD